MIDSLLVRSDVQNIIKDAKQKDKNSKENNIKKPLLYQNNYFLSTIESLYKFKIIINDDKLLDEYIISLAKLIDKIKDEFDIEYAINKLVVQTTCKKLGFEDTIIKKIDEKQKIYDYIFNKYIINGYIFHGTTNVYKKEIQTKGIIPEKYQNNYKDFLKIKDIFSRHTKTEIIEKNFNEDYICFTDNFKKAYFYATHSPMYYSSLLENNYIINSRRMCKDAYYKKDRKKCLSNLNLLTTTLNLTLKEEKVVKDICNNEWDKLNIDNSSPMIILIKRKKITKKELEKFQKIREKLSTTDVYDCVNKILNGTNNYLKISEKILTNEIEYIEFKNNNIIYKVKKQEKRKIIPEDNYGKASFLILLGSTFLALGVIITIITFMKGV